MSTIRKVLGGRPDSTANVSCPVPDHGRGRGDKNPSLSVAEGHSGPVFHCRAGCDQAEVYAAVTMKLEDAGYSLPVPEPTGATTPRAPTQGTTGYTCTGPDGDRIHFRRDGPDGKRMWWAKDGPSPKRLLFRAGGKPAERDDRRPFLVTEGEKAALAAAEKLKGLYHVFGTATGASSQPDRDVWKHHGFTRRRVLLWPDHDPEGQRQMEHVAADLRALECQIAFVDPLKLDLRPKGDAADWQVSDSREAGRLLKQATVNPKPSHVAAFRTLREWDDAPDEETEPILRNVAWPGRLSAIHGFPGSGKTRLLADGAAAVTRGDRWLGRATIVGGGTVLWIACEDPAGARKLLRKHGANEDRLIIGDGQALFAEGSWAHTLPDLVKEFKPDLIVVDSLASLVAISGEGVDSNNADHVTRLLQPLVDAAAKGAGVDITHHEPHGERRLRNSSAIAAVVDVVVRVARESESSQVTEITLGTKVRFGLVTDPRLRAVLSPDGTRFHLEAQAPAASPDADAPALPGFSGSDMELASRILKFLEERPNGAKRQEIVKGVRGRTERIVQVLDGMVEEGMVRRHAPAASGSKRNPARFSLVADSIPEA